MADYSAGYLSTPLRKKLGIKEGLKVAILNPPPGYREKLGNLTGDLDMAHESDRPLDFVQVFAESRDQLREEFPRIAKRLSRKGMLWVS